MTTFFPGPRLSRLAQLLCFLLFVTFSACNNSVSETSGGNFPAQEGFNEKGSDKKAIALADHMVEKMGGYDAWQNARFIAWAYFGQYNIWDKKEGLFRHEKGNLVSLMNLNKRAGQVYLNGQPIVDTVQMYNYLSQAYTHFVSNTYFLAMPFKLKDSGVTLKYRGENKTLEGKPADVIRITFDSVGISPDNMHDLWIEKESGLPAQWAFYGSRQDPQPAFIRKWSDYKDFDGLKLATNRNSPNDTLSISHLVVTDVVPKEVFLSPTAADKSKVK